MQFQKFLYPVLVIGLIALAYFNYKWTGVAMVISGLVMWALLHFNRLLQVLKRAANRPIGFVGSAVMLNAKLKKGVSLMHVIALTKSLGELLTEKDAQPEIFRWTDGTHSHVTGIFLGGRLQSWELFRPEQDKVSVNVNAIAIIENAEKSTIES